MRVRLRHDSARQEGTLRALEALDENSLCARRRGQSWMLLGRTSGLVPSSPHAAEDCDRGACETSEEEGGSGRRTKVMVVIVQGGWGLRQRGRQRARCHRCHYIFACFVSIVTGTPRKSLRWLRRVGTADPPGKHTTQELGTQLMANLASRTPVMPPSSLWRTRCLELRGLDDAANMDQVW